MSEKSQGQPSPTDPVMKAGGLQTLKAVFLRLFVLFHLIAITVWALPRAPQQYFEGTAKFELRTDGVVPFLKSTRDLLTDGTLYFNDKYMKESPVKFYVLGTGFWQYWDMFSPNPSSVDLWGDAEVIYKNGSVKRYQYPRMYALPIPQKYLKERYRKFYERASLSDNNYMWPQFAQRIAYLNNNDPNNPPVTVKLHRHRLTIAPPGERQLDKYSDELYYTWNVDQQGLKDGRPAE